MNNKDMIENLKFEKQVEILESKEISSQLKTSDEYVYRHIGNSQVTIDKALKTLGLNNIDELIDEVVPEDIRLTPGNRFRHMGKELTGIDSETLMLHRMRSFKDNNIINKNFIG
jgi:glycine cleavage system pyridoxal-binding protein P